MEGGERIPALRSAKCCAVFKTARANAEDDARFAFVCGFLSHMALDIVFHPWVYAVTGPYYDPDPDRQADSQMSHRLVESWLDLLMLRRFEKTSTDFDPLKAIRANRMIQSRLPGFLRRKLQNRVEDRRRCRALSPAFLHRPDAAGTAVSLPSRNGGRRLRQPFDQRTPARVHGPVLSNPARTHACSTLRISKASATPSPARLIDSNLDQLWNEAREFGTRLLIGGRDIRAGNAPVSLDAVLQGRSLNIGLSGTPSDRATHFDIFPVERMWGYPGPAAGIAR